MGSTERSIRFVLWQCGVLGLVGFVLVLAAVTIEAIPDLFEAFKHWIPGMGGGVAMAAIIGQGRLSRLAALLTPNTFSTAEFNRILLKYRRFQNFGSGTFLFLGILGIVIGTFSQYISG